MGFKDEHCAKYPDIGTKPQILKVIVQLSLHINITWINP
jgi:hypothetical protein